MRHSSGNSTSRKRVRVNFTKKCPYSINKVGIKPSKSYNRWATTSNNDRKLYIWRYSIWIWCYWTKHCSLGLSTTPNFSLVQWKTSNFKFQQWAQRLYCWHRNSTSRMKTWWWYQKFSINWKKLEKLEYTTKTCNGVRCKRSSSLTGICSESFQLTSSRPSS